MTTIKKLSLVALVPVLITLGILLRLNYEHTHPAKVVALAQTVVNTDPITPDQLYKDVEVERAKAGVPPLTRNPKLDQSATDKCNDMVTYNYYEHINPITGKRGVTYIFTEIPNSTVGSENLNQGNATTSMDFVNSWLGSPAHKAAMLNPKYTDTGFAVCTEGGKTTVVEHFAIIPKN